MCGRITHPKRHNSRPAILTSTESHHHAAAAGNLPDERRRPPRVRVRGRRLRQEQHRRLPRRPRPRLERQQALLRQLLLAHPRRAESPAHGGAIRPSRPRRVRETELRVHGRALRRGPSRPPRSPRARQRHPRRYLHGMRGDLELPLALRRRAGQGGGVRGPGAAAEPRAGLGTRQPRVLRRTVPDQAPGAAQVRLRRVRKGQRGVVPEHRHRSRAREAINRGDFEGAPGGLRADHGGPHRDRLAPVPTAHPRPVPGARGWEIADLPGRGRQRVRQAHRTEHHRRVRARRPLAVHRGLPQVRRARVRFRVQRGAHAGRRRAAGDAAAAHAGAAQGRGWIQAGHVRDGRFEIRARHARSRNRGSERVQRAARALAVVAAAHEYHLASARQRHGPAGVGGEGTVAGNHAGWSAGDVQKTRFELDGHRGAGSGVGSAGKTDSQRLQQAELTAHDGG